ncbi:hypothetical protein NFI96_005570 [Prochilodus magdalenae]|nr:hypothetical protein NFI96_005570 [Prochilodus magdalenae]
MSGWRMNHSMLRSFIIWSIILHCNRAIYATPILSNLSTEGSGDAEDGKSELTPSPSVISNITKHHEATAGNNEEEGTHMEHYLLNKMVDFLRENLFLILVITCLLLVIFFIICSALLLSHRRKVSAYYPCSFPAKMYVDEADKTGGGRVFIDVPEKLAGRSVEEPVNSAKQLQDDIILATRSLRTPTKTPWREEKDINPADVESSPQANGEREERREVNNTQETASNEAKEETESKTSQDALSVGHMEKSDLSSPDLPSESEHPSGSDILEAREKTDKQEAVASAVAFISEEKTAF